MERASFFCVMPKTIDANNEKTRAFPIDSSGRYVLRIGVSGVEGTQYKVELGGSAYQAN